MSSYLVVQISDPHLTVSGSLPPGVRPRDNLVRGLRLLGEAGLRPDVFLLTGDLADAGDGPTYDDLASILADAARASGASVVYLPGNHDDRDTFRRHLLGGAGDGPLNQVHWRDGLRIIALDSTVPGEGRGALGEATLAWLRSELATPAPDGTVIALHHPPVPSPVSYLSAITLAEQARLGEAIAGSDVRIVISGHYHHVVLGTLGTVPVWVSPSAAYQADTASPAEFRGLLASAFSRLDLAGDSLTVTVFPVPAG